MDIPHKDEVIQTAIVYGSLSLVFVFCQIFFSVKMKEIPSEKGSPEPNYGVSAFPVAQFLLRFGLMLSLLTLALGFAYVPVCSDRYMICNSFLNLQMFVYFVLAFTIDTLMVPWFNRQAADNMHLVGNEQVFLSMCYRGPLLVAVAKKLNKGGKVIVRDPWNTQSCKASDEWVRENLNREGVPIDRCDISNGDARSLNNIEDGAMDVVINNSLSFAYDNEDFTLVAHETDRILKCGGKLVVIQTIFGDDLGELMLSNGYTIIYEKVVFKLPLPLKVTTAIKKSSIDSKTYIEKREEYEFEKQYMKPLKKYYEPVYTSYFPLLTLFISTIIFAALCYILYYVWNDIDIPRSLQEEAYNRLSSGFIAPSVLWAGYAMIENFRILRDEYASNEIESVGKLFKKYINFLFIGVLLASLWNVIWWLPGFLFDMYVAPKVPSVPVAFWNIMLSYIIFYTLAKGGQAFREYGIKQKKKARQQKRQQLTSIQSTDEDERLPLLTK